MKDALLITEDFQNNFSILYPTEKSNLIFIELLNKYSPRGLKIHDHEIISISLSNKIYNIATLNKKDFSIVEEIEVVSIK